MELSLVENGRIVPILIEECAFEGVRRIGETVASDIELVTGIKPRMVTEKDLDGKGTDAVIFCATWGKSPLLARMAKERRQGLPLSPGEPEFSGVEGKREVYQIFFARNPFPGVGQALVICGSDKRGTIYGMFALSEYLGVTPLVFWGDSAPRRLEKAVIREDICTLSKEPSVYYRGFFINDEWPCFGTWVTEHFGGFHAGAYRHVFEFLLRMRGNYLWPAMWTASFPLDGPGGANEELADIYGVVMGYSHHEPCLRASEEWDQVRGEGSPYGNQWNFYTNEQGLLRYWEDSLKRSGKYENVITIGMRGERDSSMLGDDATVAENVALLKDIITKQRQLIRKNVDEDLSKVPQMLALYKEVEAYFYGDGTVPGLKDWEELDEVICMLCEDNFGHMRTLPTEEIRNHKGGFGMYYHFDYHGGPVSYEWIDSTPLSKTWEQMCMAYEYGIRKLWIVNVGDVKFHEVPLTYFMNLAYDYGKWGVDNPDSAREYTEKWAAENFWERSRRGAEGCFGMCESAKMARGTLRERITEVFTEYIGLLSLRRPEAMNEGTYHPCHYLEADRMLKQILEVEKASCGILEELGERDKKGYYSMVHYPLTAGMNLMKMHLYAGKNRHYANQGRWIANDYGRLAEECIARDRELAEEFGRFQGGKWNGMQLAPHIGFTRWNEDGCRYPMVCHVMPVRAPRLSVSRKDEERVYYKNYGSPEVVKVDDFLYEGCQRVTLELANDGGGTLCCRIVPETGELPEWLEIRQGEWGGFLDGIQSGAGETGLHDPSVGNGGSEGSAEWLSSAGNGGSEGSAEWLSSAGNGGSEGSAESLPSAGNGRRTDPEGEPSGPRHGNAPEIKLMGGTVWAQREVELCCLRQKLPKGISRHRLLVTDGDTVVAVEVSARKIAAEELPDMTFLPKDGVVVMDARHYASKSDVDGAGFQVLENYGKYGSGVKVFPVTVSFGEPAAMQGSAASGKFPGQQDSVSAQMGPGLRDRPWLTYQFLAEQAGTYRVELLAAPTNSPVQGMPVRLLVSLEGAEAKTAELVGRDFRAGDHRDEAWCRGVLDQVRTASVLFEMEAGVQRLAIGPVDAGTVLERIRIYPSGRQLPESYLGPEESYCFRKN